MTVNIEGSALSIPKSLDSLRVTPLVMHRIVFDIVSVAQWYAIMKEARTLFGKNWRCQAKVKRRLERIHQWEQNVQPIPVWFEVPDPAFSTWVAVKLAVFASTATTK